mmetsp:Transcript_21327/g.33004  ORF Transcript_21327/g.33004 Transcript_21327/m.33004 type:complete len:135 (-) Transcript_21327:1754-2158(-)|eukprot:CAMPEP_0170482456 /NCGR_PEP_ID=MMETSP0208-20121228/2468_1 /TAXON_ID=197538 /ORGANISM="Strombidium inclinatum, Strain S3" /LENGTH=134 /DNA_ID=CAMNT_0010755297 /DNA_START=1874 /DNA_END=2278 /DNA_ORIENTATION=-
MKIESQVSSILQVEEKSAPIKPAPAHFSKLTSRHGSAAPQQPLQPQPREKIRTQRHISSNDAVEPITDRRVAEISREYTLSNQSIKKKPAAESSRVFVRPKPKVSAIQSPSSSQSKSQIQFYPTHQKKGEELVN